MMQYGSRCHIVSMLWRKIVERYRGTLVQQYKAQVAQQEGPQHTASDDLQLSCHLQRVVVSKILF